jgi:hypothetical protein
MANPVWIGIDPGARMGICAGELRKSSLIIHSDTLKIENKDFATDPNRRLGLLRNVIRMWVRRYEKHPINGVVIEDPVGVKGKATVLHEYMGVIIPVIYDEFKSFDVPIYRLTQPALKKFAINKNPKRDEAIMLMSRRADKDYNFTPESADEVMAFWCMMFGYSLWYDPTEKFRQESIARYKKSHGMD